MNRRRFLASSAALGVATVPFANTTGATADGREYIEWIRYTVKNRSEMGKVRDFYRDAAIPALNRIGLDRIGFFNVTYGESGPYYYVLIPHPDMSSVLTYRARLMEDEVYKRAGADFLEAPLSDPAYMRVDTVLMHAFKGIPRVEVDKDLLGNKRIMELRTYESHSYMAGQKKIHMFNEGGEIDIFRKTGLKPVFFGETVIGADMPNLIYMLVFESMEQRNKNWDAFRVHPEWKKLSADPFYKDTVSNITDIVLTPESFSQI